MWHIIPDEYCTPVHIIHDEYPAWLSKCDVLSTRGQMICCWENSSSNKTLAINTTTVHLHRQLSPLLRPGSIIRLSTLTRREQVKTSVLALIVPGPQWGNYQRGGICKAPFSGTPWGSSLYYLLGPPRGHNSCNLHNFASGETDPPRGVAPPLTAQAQWPGGNIYWKLHKKIDLFYQNSLLLKIRY